MEIVGPYQKQNVCFAFLHSVQHYTCFVAYHVANVVSYKNAIQ